MPYRHAHWYLLSLFPLAGLAFWPSYLSTVGSAPLEMHAHGVTATLWLVLLVLQSWTMQAGRRDVHRVSGTASLLLFPLFLVGGVGIFFGMADRFASGSPFHQLFAPKLAWLDLVSVGGFAYFFFEALRLRRKVHPHSGYMLATVIFLLPPIFGRLSAIPLGIAGPADLPRLDTGFLAANVLTAGLAFFIAYRRGQHGRPWALAGVLTLAMTVLYLTVGAMPAWRSFYASTAAWPIAPFAFTAGLAGVLIAYLGWTAGKRRLPADLVTA